MTNKELIEKAASLVNSRSVGGFIVGDVGCALLTKDDNLFVGVCIDTSSSMGFCAEHNAIGSMVTAGEYNIKKIVAVHIDAEGRIAILSPFGRCREFMRQIDEKNLETEVILSIEKSVKLKELLPYHDWYHHTN